MNAIDPALARAAEGGLLIRLRRDGAPPLRFAGRKLAAQDGACAQAGLWHEIGFYAGRGGDWALGITLWRASPRGRAAVRCHAWRFDTLETAVVAVETHDAAGDVCPGIAAPELPLDDAAATPLTLALRAAGLERVRRDVARRYRIGAGALLAALAWQGK